DAASSCAGCISSQCAILSVHRTYPPLLSSPTRRSSDQPTSEPARTGPERTGKRNATSAPCSSNGPTPAPTAAKPPAAEHGALVRSEEHTSELQSRENLVCRLLPEKKKGAKIAVYVKEKR